MPGAATDACPATTKEAPDKASAEPQLQRGKGQGRKVAEMVTDPFVKFCDQSSPLLVRSMKWYPKIIYTVLILSSFFVAGGWQLYVLFASCTEGNGCMTCSISLHTKEVEDAECSPIAVTSLGTTWSGTQAQLTYENNWPMIVQKMDEMKVALDAIDWFTACHLVDWLWPGDFLPASRFRKCNSTDMRDVIDNLWSAWQLTKSNAVVNKQNQLSDLRRPYHRPEYLRQDLAYMDNTIYLMHVLYYYGTGGLRGVWGDRIAVVNQVDGRSGNFLLLQHNPLEGNDLRGPDDFFSYFHATKWGKDPTANVADRGMLVDFSGPRFGRFPPHDLDGYDYISPIHPNTLQGAFQECCTQMSNTNKLAVSYAFGSVVMGVFGLGTAMSLYPLMSRLTKSPEEAEFDQDIARGAAEGGLDIL